MPAATRRRKTPLSGPGWVIRFKHTVSATVSGLERVHKHTMRVVRAMGCAAGEEDKVDVALREALTNAVVHGSGLNPRKRITVHCFCSETRGMMLLVRDRGRGFDPTQIPDPTAGDNIYKAHGRGIFLIRVMMDQVRYRRGGRDVVMRKRGRGVGFKKTAQNSSARRRPS